MLSRCWETMDMNSGWAARQWKNTGRFVALASSICFLKYLAGKENWIFIRTNNNSQNKTVNWKIHRKKSVYQCDIGHCLCLCEIVWTEKERKNKTKNNNWSISYKESIVVFQVPMEYDQLWQFYVKGGWLKAWTQSQLHPRIVRISQFPFTQQDLLEQEMLEQEKLNLLSHSTCTGQVFSI